MNVSMIFFFLLGAAALVDSKRDKENLNRDTTPFWLEDPNDGLFESVVRKFASCPTLLFK